MDQLQQKIEQIKSLDPNDRHISPQNGVCRFEPGEDAQVRRAKEEKVAEALRVRRGGTNIDGFVPAQSVQRDGEYIATRQEGNLQLHCIAWRDHGRWRRLSGWSQQMPESALPHAEIVFAPEPGLLYPLEPSI
jgi:hypothetical protein